MKHDQRLVEFYGRLGRRNGVSPEILLHEARVEFRKAWRRDLLEALFHDGREICDGAASSVPSASSMPAAGGKASRLRLRMENAWLWLYYKVDVEEDSAPIRVSGRTGQLPMARARSTSGGPIADRILAAKNGCDRLPVMPIRESLEGLFTRVRAGGGEPGRDARYILGPR